MKKYIIILCFLVVASIQINAQQSEFSKLSGLYLGQKLSNDSAEVFAKGFVSTESIEYMIMFNAVGTEVYFTRPTDTTNHHLRFLYSKMENGRWIEPVEFPMMRDTYFRQILNPQGNKIYCISNRVEKSVEGKPNLIKFYYFERNDNGWQGPSVIEFGDDFPYDAGHLSVASNGNIYFQTGYRIYGNEDIYFMKFENGAYLTPVKLSGAVNTSENELHPYISPDESYLIFDAERSEGFGNNDLYITFKDKNGDWTKAINMGPKVNSVEDERRSYVSTDGKYLFFEKRGDIYWVSAKIIKDLRKEALKNDI